VSRPKLLDLFCCEGGASMGYSRAGFDVYGVDLFEDYSQKRYPFPAHKGDALRVFDWAPWWKTGIPFTLVGGSVEWLYLRDFDAIAASPPCQRYSITNAARKADYPDLIAPTRKALKATGLPYVIENVVGAPLIDPLTLCWSMFNHAGSVIDDDRTPLRMERHRLFESNTRLLATASCHHPRDVQVAGSYGGARRDKVEARTIRKGGYVPSIPVQRRLLGIDWMTQKGMHQSIPPAYTEFIGRQLLAQIGERAA
jgi:DNA (cytosine-5)-methyltransferase 1